MFRRGSDEKNSGGGGSSRTHTWRTCGHPIFQRMGDIFWVAVIYLASELLIWALTFALSPVELQFLSSISGMVLVFAFMVSVSQLCPGSDGFYHRNVKSKVRLFPKPFHPVSGC
ncbi:hypothetical protein ColLi_12274 [Colletotrichum liriopes]|uniref:Uncharacterized protein n=1 Tax=Colletotrichum liriopes TaxID=708192 RepID=A0AA37GZZ4_9PEZI|nr:hypothetical protein ColLi_12274 [Colletotrichum liriopes]